MNRFTTIPARVRTSGFTLVELLVSTAILAMILLIGSTALNSVQRSYMQARSKSEQFQDARRAFEVITRNLAQATLNTYRDYYYLETLSNVPPATGSAAPSSYVRQSELRFRTGAASDLLPGESSSAELPGHAVFFQAPLGLTTTGNSLGSLLNARGYYVQYSGDDKERPEFISEEIVPVKRRYRLMEYRPAADSTASGGGNSVYKKPDTWFRDGISTASRVVADNILLLIVAPRVPEDSLQTGANNTAWIAPSYRYNSADPNNATDQMEALRINADGTVAQGTQHLLPPMIDVTLVAVDDASFERWMQQRGGRPIDITGESGATFQQSARQARDVQALGQYLDRHHLNYRIFTATVSLRNAQWDGRASQL